MVSPLGLPVNSIRALVSPPVIFHVHNNDTITNIDRQAKEPSDLTFTARGKGNLTNFTLPNVRL